tara:strand:- start:1261 stop:1491 length:231 start_codon:yes stop_codon:yes gene_type:complete
MNPTNKAAMQKWVCSLPSKELGDLLHFAFQEKAKRKKAAKKLEKSRFARERYENNKLKDKTENILIDDNMGKKPSN